MKEISIVIPVYNSNKILYELNNQIEKRNLTSLSNNGWILEATLSDRNSNEFIPEENDCNVKLSSPRIQLNYDEARKQRIKALRNIPNKSITNIVDIR